MRKFGKRLQVYILAVLAAVVLSGCVGQEQEMKEKRSGRRTGRNRGRWNRRNRGNRSRGAARRK